MTTSSDWLALAERARKALKEGNRKAREIARLNGAKLHHRRAAQAQEKDNG